MARFRPQVTCLTLSHFFSFTGIVRSPGQGTPNRDAMRLWTALGAGLCRVAATRHKVCAYPCPDTPTRDAVRLWTALGPRLCRVAATKHQVCAVSIKNSAALGLGGSEAHGIVSRRGRGEGQTGSSGTTPLPILHGHTPNAFSSAKRNKVCMGTRPMPPFLPKVINSAWAHARCPRFCQK